MFVEELWESVENRVKQYVQDQAKAILPLEPIGDGEHVVLRSPTALANFHHVLHGPEGSIHRVRVRSLDASWSTEIPLSIQDAINMVCVLSQLPNLVSLSVNMPIHMPFPFVDPIRPSLSKALATQLMLEGLAWESHAGTRDMARHYHVLPPDFLYVLSNFAALSNLRVLDTTLGFLTRLPERVCANVTNLAVIIISAQQNEACATIERKFRRSLRRLKITRLFKHAVRKVSPTRICALLGAKELEYLEVVDRDVTGGVCRVPGRRDSDVLLGTEEARAAAYECPQLRTIVWEPSWSSRLVDTYDIERSTHRYQGDLLATFGSPLEVYLRVNEAQGVRVALEDDGRPNKCPMVRDLGESLRWDVLS
ncbi:hypothetical protein GSI_11883 [Ganoderma sinense ZZ0214-1]|uniref:Uncharacterized protein n=1 Tax=Ganoderma sinense ZZ0214-1 TaxID=1077348 RepID=A0A2G8RXT3_9APHY|nr:hypothetical protein GSI_11883 [Ganoderma sinense ZZ0214-1]